MASIGFVLISTDAGKEHDVFEQLQHLKDVTELHTLFGEYDIIAKVVGENPTQINSIVTSKIQTIPNVASTHTLLGLKI